MEFDQSYHWLIQSERRKAILLDFDQPLSATHISRRTGINLDACLHLIWGMTVYGILYCLNPGTRHNRLQWLTNLGKACQSSLRQRFALRPILHRFPRIPWNLYSSVCFSHRTAVLKAMQGAMQAAEIKRRALFQEPRLKMSANNVRDVMRYLVKHGIVFRMLIPKKVHPRYELSDLGRVFKDLLVGARAFYSRSEVASFEDARKVIALSPNR